MFVTQVVDASVSQSLVLSDLALSAMAEWRPTSLVMPQSYQNVAIKFSQPGTCSFYSGCTAVLCSNQSAQIPLTKKVTSII